MKNKDTEKDRKIIDIDEFKQKRQKEKEKEKEERILKMFLEHAKKLDW